MLFDCNRFTLSLESAACVCLVTYTAILFSPLVFIPLSLSGNCKSQKIAFVKMLLRFRAPEQSHYQFTSPVGNQRLFSTSNSGVGHVMCRPGARWDLLSYVMWYPAALFLYPGDGDRAAELLAGAANEPEPPCIIFHLHAEYGYVHL